MGAVVELDACWLVVILQDILISLHRVDRQKLHLTFKLDGAAHFHRRVPPAHIRGSPTHSASWRGGANTLKSSFRLCSNLVPPTPGRKFFIGEHGSGLLFPLDRHKWTHPHIDSTLAIFGEKEEERARALLLQ